MGDDQLIEYGAEVFLPNGQCVVTRRGLRLLMPSWYWVAVASMQEDAK